VLCLINLLFWPREESRDGRSGGQLGILLSEAVNVSAHLIASRVGDQCVIRFRVTVYR